MTLKEHIDDIRDRLKKGEFPNEAAVCDDIVRRLVHELGWPRYQSQIVYPQYPVEGGRVDFALCHPPSKPRVFIEVKQVEKIEGAEEQLFRYAFQRGVPIAILTDGREWQFFYPTGEGTWAERKVCELDLTTEESAENAEKLNRYLNYESIRTSEAVEAIKADYEKVVQQRQVAARLPEAWGKLLEEADELLLEVVAEKTENLCGYRPTDEQVLSFLKKLSTPSAPTPSKSAAVTVATTKSEESFTVNGIKRTVNTEQIAEMRAKYNETGKLKYSTQLLVDWKIIKPSEKNGAWSFVKKMTGHVSQSKKSN